MKWAVMQNRAGTEAVAGCGEGLGGRLASSFFLSLFPISISFLKQANKFEFNQV
jgi:hypothetical protein